MTDLLYDINEFIKSTAIDLDKYFATGLEVDNIYKDAQLELLRQLIEITARYE